MRSGFTLFEVGISLWIMAIAVTTVVMVLPTGIKLQQTARYQVFAAAKALSLVASMSSRTQLARSLAWNEGNGLVDGVHVNAGYRMADLHQVANFHQGGMGAILPLALARRLDSTGDEIARILDEGGDIFYVPPFSSNMLYHYSATDATEHADTGMRRLIFAFRGHAQQNALISHPQTAWPYINPQPGRGAPWENLLWDEAGLTRPDPDDYVLTSEQITLLGLPLPLTEPLPDTTAIASWHTTLTDTRFPGACLALRNHAYASLKLATASGDADDITQARIDHEWMLRFLMFARHELPDDLRVPRLPYNQVMTDIPLLQYDLFGPAVLATPGAFPAKRADPEDARWRTYSLLSERALTFTRSWSYENTPVIPDTTTGRFNLTAPFDAAERCRQMVVWIVDWQNYEDAETLPASPLDNGRLSWRPSGPSWAARQQNKWSRAVTNEWELFFTDTTRTDTLGPFSEGNLDAFQNSTPPMRALGRYGVDRNGNGVHDVGSIRSSVRLRAVTVARFNLYDPRGHVILR